VAAIGPTLEDVDLSTVRWGVDADGHVYWSHETAAPPPGPFAWTSTTFRDRLGFTGQELGVVQGGATVYTAERPCPGVLTPSRPLAEPVERWVDQLSDAVRSLDGSIYRVEHSTSQGLRVVVYVDGPLDAGEELRRHLLHRWLPYQADRVTLYQDWGDTRRRGWAVDGQGYGILRTVESGGYRGRCIGVLAPAQEQVSTMTATAGLYRRGTWSVRLVEVPDA
jgi:hypothetical protein